MAVLIMFLSNHHIYSYNNSLFIKFECTVSWLTPLHPLVAWTSFRDKSLTVMVSYVRCAITESRSFYSHFIAQSPGEMYTNIRSRVPHMLLWFTEKLWTLLLANLSPARSMSDLIYVVVFLCWLHSGKPQTCIDPPVWVCMCIEYWHILEF